MVLPYRFFPTPESCLSVWRGTARVLALALLAALALVGAACSDKGEGGDDGGGDTDTQAPQILELVPSEIELHVDEALSPLVRRVDSESHQAVEIAASEVDWESSDVDIVTVEGGVLIGVAPGEATITATYGELSAEASVTVHPPRPTIRFPFDTVVLSRVGDSVPLSPIAEDRDGTVLASDPALFTYESADESIVTVDENGVVTARDLGETIVQVTFEAAVGTVWVRVEHVIVDLTFQDDPVHLDYVGHRVALVPVGLDVEGNTVEQKLTGLAWESSDESVARVDDDGLVTAVDDGVATILARYGDIEGEATVIVRQKAAVIQVWNTDAAEPEEETSLHFDQVGATARLSARAWDAADVRIPLASTDFEWTSTDPAVAVVNGEGLVTAAGRGQAGIRVERDGTTVIVPVSVSQTPTTIELTPQSLTFSSLGQTELLTAVVLDASGDPVATTPESFGWESVNRSIVTVNGVGEITAVGNGTTKILVTFEGLSALADVTVTQVPATFEISPRDTVLSLGQTFTPVVEARDAGGSSIELSDNDVVWRSSDESVAMVSLSGAISAVGTGFARIDANCKGLSAGLDIFVPSGSDWWNTLQWTDESPYIGEEWNTVLLVDDDVLLAGSSVLKWERGDAGAGKFEAGALTPLPDPGVDVLDLAVDGEKLLLLSSESIWQFDGTEWSVEHESSGLRAVSAGDGLVLAVGDGGRILRRTGDGWVSMTSPIDTDLVAVDVFADFRAWAVAATGEVLIWNGWDWSVDTEEPLPLVPVAIVEDSSGVINVLGAADGHPVLHRKVGAQWSSSTTPIEAHPNSMAVMGNGSVFVTTREGKLLEYSKGNWSVAFSARAPLHRILTDGSGFAVAAGASGTVLVHDGETWTVASGNRGNLRAVFAASRDRFFAVGEQGTFLVRDSDGDWRGLQSDIDGDFHAVWAPSGSGSGSSAWAVGTRGLVARFDNDSLAVLPSPTSVDLHAVWGDDDGTVWVSGDSGALFSWDGEAWTDALPGETRTLLTATGIDGRLWFAGEDGLAVDSDGNAIDSDLGAPTFVSLAAFFDTLHALTREGHLLSLDEEGFLRTRSLASGVDSGKMWGRASDDLFLLLQVAGEGTKLFRYDGTSRNPVDAPGGGVRFDARYEAISGAGNRVVLAGEGGRILLGER